MTSKQLIWAGAITLGVIGIYRWHLSKSQGKALNASGKLHNEQVYISTVDGKILKTNSPQKATEFKNLCLAAGGYAVKVEK